MRRNLATLSLSLLLMGICAAEDPVARVQSIKPVVEGGSAALFRKRPTDTESFKVSVNSSGYIKDNFKTDANTLAALEFLIGGRVGINKNTEIEIVDAKSVADANVSVKRIIMKNGSLWVKADAKALKQPIEIQTNGGVMGIKGTEFTIDTQTDGTTKVCCFESNSDIGGVEVRDNSGKVLGVAKPGDEYLLSLKAAPVVKHTDNIQEFRESTLRSGYSEMMNDPAFQAFYGTFGSYLPYGVGSAFYTISAIENIEKDPVGAYMALSSALSHAGVSTPSLGGWGGMISAASRNNSPPKPDFPSELSPDASTNSTKPKQTTPYPQFSWNGVDDANGYVVMIGRDENMNDVLFTERVRNTQLNYPREMRPLDVGQYYWRVIPVNDEDRPVQRASQTIFVVAK